MRSTKLQDMGVLTLNPRLLSHNSHRRFIFLFVEDCLPLAEEKFREVIKTNYYTRTKFGCKLTSEQVKNLCKLFTSASKESGSEESGSQLKSETSIMAKRGRSMGRHVHKKKKTERARQAKWVEVEESRSMHIHICTEVM
ncbi:uncharacterized protein LOC107825331 [Nicotiana tabacum]|uniref:Uncharacterized protein LOC107825331 n=1 Tax=Nicotiana tabacum TaxID=4097 RepID=A0AC58TUU6_TOBAC